MGNLNKFNEQNRSHTKRSSIMDDSKLEAEVEVKGGDQPKAPRSTYH